MKTSKEERIEKEIELLILLASGKAYSVKEICEHLGVKAPSVYRYIATLKRCHIAIIIENRKYRFPKDNDRYLKNILHLTEEEAHILFEGINNIHDDTPIKQTIREKLCMLFNIIGLPECTIKPKNAPNINAVSKAIKEHKKVIFHDYSSSNSGTVRDRYVEPFGFTTNYAEIWCYDLEDNKNKTYKTARIGQAEVLPESWENGHAHRKGFVDVFRMTGYDRIRVRLRLGVMAYNLLIEEHPLAERDIAQLDETHWILDTYVANFLGIGRFVIPLAHDIKILDCPGLVQYIKDYVNANLTTL